MLKNNTISSCLIASMCSGRLYPAARLCFFQRWLLEAQTGRELAHSFMGTYCIWPGAQRPPSDLFSIFCPGENEQHCASLNNTSRFLHSSSASGNLTELYRVTAPAHRAKPFTAGVRPFWTLPRQRLWKGIFDKVVNRWDLHRATVGLRLLPTLNFGSVKKWLHFAPFFH